MQYLIQCVLRFPKVTLLLLIVISSLSLFPLRSLKVGEVREEWLHKNDPLLMTYINFQKQFCPGEQVLLAYHLPNGLTPNEVLWQKKLRESIDTMPGVVEIQGVSSLSKLRKAKSKQEIDSLIYSFSELQGTLLSEDGSMTALLVTLGDKKKRMIASSETIGLFKREITELIDSLQENEGRRIFRGGHLFAAEEISEGITYDIGLLFPLTILFAIIILFLTFRNWAYTLLPIVSTGSAILWTISLKALFCSPLTPLSSTLFVLISVLGVADSLHLFSHLHQALQSGKTHQEALRYSFTRAGKACFFTTLTTAVGFFSLALSSMPIIRDLGIYAGLGIFFAFLTSMLSLPLSIAFFPVLPAPKALPLTPLIQSVSQTVFRYKNVILWGGILFILILFPAFFRSEVDSSVAAYLKKGSSTRRDMDTIRNNLHGVGSTEIVITADSAFFRDLQMLKKLDSLHHSISTHPRVTGLVSFATSFKTLGPKQKKHLGKRSFQNLLHKRFHNYVSPHFEKVRISVFTSPMTSSEKDLFFNDVQARSKQEFPQAAVDVTGLDRLTQLTTKKIVKTQFESLLTATVVIFTIMLLLFGFKGGVVAIMVNLFPIVTIFGLIGYGGFPLNIATATIAAVAIGVVVDDTIHFHFAFRRGLDKGLSTVDAIKNAHKDVGEAMVVSSLIIIAGVLLFLFARTGLMVQFGLLAAASMFIALLADLYWGPALLSVLYRKRS